MSRWTVFDSSTADAAQGAGRNVELKNTGSVTETLQDAVAAQQPVVIVLPAGPERATVARITPPQRPATVTPINDKKMRGPDVSYVPGGMLGLNESVAIDDAPQTSANKKWWEKLFR